MKSPNYKWIAVYGLLGMIILHGAMFWKLHNLIFQGYGDFASFYTAGKLVERGQSAHLYDRHLQWQIQQEFAPAVQMRRGPLSYVRPPFEALLFLPLAYFTYPIAYLGWSILNLAILLAVPFLLPSSLSALKLSPLRQGILCLGFFPVGLDLLGGQDSIVLLLVITMAFRSMQRGADLRAGMFLGLGLFKFHFLIPIFLVFLIRKKFSVVLGFLSTACILLLISVLLVGPSGVLGYPRYLWDLDHQFGLGMTTPWSMPNLRGLLMQFFREGINASWVNWVFLAIVIAGIAVAARSWRIDSRNPRVMAAGFSFMIVAIIVTSYFASSYDLTLLLIPIFLLGGYVSSGEIQGWPRAILLSCVTLFLLGPLWWVIILRFDMFFCMAFVLLLLAVALGKILERWQRFQSTIQQQNGA